MENINTILADICDVPDYDSDDILDLMDDLEMEERAFAILMNVETITVRLWISGVSRPSSTARRLMQIYREIPCVLDCLLDYDNEDDIC